MPFLDPIPIATKLASFDDAKADFLIFYSSQDSDSSGETWEEQDSKMWCSDCRRVAKIIREAFQAEDSPTAQIVYVGQRSDWKPAESHYRADPWYLESIPTVLRKNDNIRLVDEDIDKDDKLLASFISSTTEYN